MSSLRRLSGDKAKPPSGPIAPALLGAQRFGGTVVARRTVAAYPALTSAVAAAADQRRGTIRAERAKDARSCVAFRAKRCLTAVAHALPAVGAVDRREALELAEVGPADEVDDASCTSRVVRSTVPSPSPPPAVRRPGARFVRRKPRTRRSGRGGNRSPPGTGRGTARRRRTPATAGSGVVPAVPLFEKLADVERAIARDAPQPGRTIARGLARVVALAKRAHQRVVAVRVDETTLGQIGKLVARAGDAEDRQAADRERPPHRASEMSCPSFICLRIPLTGSNRKRSYEPEFGHCFTAAPPENLYIEPNEYPPHPFWESTCT